MPDLPESEDEELLRARRELQAAYQFFNWATEPRFVDEAIRRIQAAESRIDNLTHSAKGPQMEALPWHEPNTNDPVGR